jgi:hypothetical protein
MITIEEEKQHYTQIKFDQYHPKTDAEVKLLVRKDLPVPTLKDFRPGCKIAWAAALCKERDLVLVNFIHREYPAMYCQMQLFFSGKQEKRLSTQHIPNGLRDHRIPAELIEQLYQSEIRPELVEQLPFLFE